MSNKTRASEMLQHYISMAVENGGTYDNDQEMDALVQYIIDAAVEAMLAIQRAAVVPQKGGRHG